MTKYDKQVSMQEQDVVLKREEGTQVTEGASLVSLTFPLFPFSFAADFSFLYNFLFSPSCFEIAGAEAMCKSAGHIFRLCS